MQQTIDTYWETFLAETGRDANTKYAQCFYFGATEKLANDLLQLVLEGKKTATSSALIEYINNNEQLPQIGDLSIVTDWEGTPHCIIENTDVFQIKFKDMTYDICKQEGEDDTLESWQNNHIDFFNEFGPEYGYTFSWDMDIVFETFKVIY